ncbi:hypothetical protein KV100_13940 [Mumia sp. zg.B21]|uniref:fibrinogen-like YCDxxxxGGGW domain-containing protein n=1 Tax=Mumia sp. zg.B21 TaxID=2855447 RepID=UPI001C6E38F4|nr:fibrinogen-like YCDxxxxGGGW domain-containing protein [Mumia sp. zg.B21]MBW9210756.1 hypothetical protein [Mumia sp. zg.B21]
MASLALIGGLLGASLVAPQPAAAQAPGRDGSSQELAAPSCWAIKQATPSASDGAYWLLTPQMNAPARFRCDMTTDGGGWVLVGRGREGWQAQYEGQGAAASLLGERTTFATTQLASRTIDALLNGSPVKDLTDGIRLRRARDTSGSAWQEGRVTLTNRDRWVWSFGAGHLVKSYRFDGGTTRSGGTTTNFGSDNSYERVNTEFTSAQAWTSGFAYGSNVRGTTSDSSFLWSSSSTAGYARPYTEVWLRPRLTEQNTTYAAVPDSGSDAVTNRRVARSYAKANSWGVTGLATNYGGEGNVEVQAFTESDGVVYVGGNFRYVQRGASASGGDKIEQPYLAAFDRATGEPVRTFTPGLNGQVKTLATLPSGEIVAGGQFTRANGQDATAVVALDPQTGVTSTTWGVRLENRVSGAPLVVRSLSVQGTSVFVGGALTHASPASGGSASYARGAVQLSTANGTPVTTWNPEFNGTVVSVDASADGARLYAAGYFEASQGTPALKAAAVLREPGAPLATPTWTPTWSASTRSNYQQAIKQVGSGVWVGGSEHSMFRFSTSTFDRTNGSIMNAGGDIQTIATGGGAVYGGCHCNNWNYQDAYLWPSTGTSFTQADKIGWIGAWDSQSGKTIPDFSPNITSSAGAGAWASFVDSQDMLWVGGDFTRVQTGASSSSWAGGFVRFDPVDSTAPVTPTGVTASTPTDDTVRLSWNASAGASSYDVIRDDRVITTSTQTTVVVPLGGDNRFFVRAADDSGNRSVSSSRVVLPDPHAPDPVLVPYGSGWSWRNQASAPDAAWKSPDFDDSAWSAGPAPFGWGFPDVGTNIDIAGASSGRAITNYFRRTFEVDPSDVRSISFTTWANDGIVLHLNGKEIARSNVGTAAVDYGRFADSAPKHAAAKVTPVTVEVPRSALRDGVNTLAAEVHVNYRSTPDLSFDLLATATWADGTEPEEAAEPEPDAEPEPVVAFGSDWTWRNDVTAPAPAWKEPAYDDTSWSRGSAPLGFGSDDIATSLDVEGAASGRTVTSYVRRTFTVDRSAIDGLTLRTWADDGVAVYVNGVEVGRANLGEGSIGHGRYADAGVRTAAAKADPLIIEVPKSVLVDGKNTLAAEIHVNYRATRDLSFDLQATSDPSQ